MTLHFAGGANFEKWVDIMKMNDRYRKLKNENKDCVVILKSGIFYTTYDSDALILNYIFNYKISDQKVGFPICAIDYVVDILKKYEINVVIDNIDEIIEKREINKSSYYYVLESAIKNVNNSNRIKDLINLVEIKLKQSEINYSLIKDFVDAL